MSCRLLWYVVRTRFGSYRVDGVIDSASDLPPSRIVFSFGSCCASSWCTYGSSRILDVVVPNRRLLQDTSRMPPDPLGGPRFLYHSLPLVPFPPSSTLSGTFLPENVHAHSGLHGDPRDTQCGYQGVTQSLRRCHPHWYVVYRCCPKYCNLNGRRPIGPNELHVRDPSILSSLWAIPKGPSKHFLTTI